MEALFYVIPVLMIAAAGFGISRVLGRSRRISAAWNSGVTAEGRCLRSYTTTSGGGDSTVHTTMHHVYEFTTHEGRTVRFDEENGPATVLAGDIVTVYYVPEHPEHATAHRPARGKLAAGTGCLVGCLGVFIALCLGFMIAAHLVISAAQEQLP
ncbi:DUF3592 domain-containing protein [Streptomyces sp. NPDC001982]|uniref:DUF3592 domain-containing protein n=1 Tax=unclassified Streptomyces TaxID=2593676 RepID=UPI0033180742